MHGVIIGSFCALPIRNEVSLCVDGNVSPKFLPVRKMADRSAALTKLIGVDKLIVDICGCAFGRLFKLCSTFSKLTMGKSPGRRYVLFEISRVFASLSSWYLTTRDAKPLLCASRTTRGSMREPNGDLLDWLFLRDDACDRLTELLPCELRRPKRLHDKIELEIFLWNKMAGNGDMMRLVNVYVWKIKVSIIFMHTQSQRDKKNGKFR